MCPTCPGAEKYWKRSLGGVSSVRLKAGGVRCEEKKPGLLVDAPSTRSVKSTGFTFGICSKFQITSTKSQINLNLKYSITKTSKDFDCLAFGHWNLFDIWYLDFVISATDRSTARNINATTAKAPPETDF